MSLFRPEGRSGPRLHCGFWLWLIRVFRALRYQVRPCIVPYYHSTHLRRSIHETKSQSHLVGNASEIPSNIQSRMACHYPLMREKRQDSRVTSHPLADALTALKLEYPSFRLAAELSFACRRKWRCGLSRSLASPPVVRTLFPHRCRHPARWIGDTFDWTTR